MADLPTIEIDSEEQLLCCDGYEGIVSQSLAFREVLELVEMVAPTNSTVLLMGETGTGKELVARAIHERSGRGGRTLAKLNCAAVPSGLLESEIFGHERGAFTGALTSRTGWMEVADNGTLFLDEVGDIPLEIQPKLLRALQEREITPLGARHTRKVNVRLIAATNRNLEEMVAENLFRSDLYYRLNVFPIRIPALRERPEDIPILVRYFSQKYARQMGKHINSISSAVMRKLVRWHWPGNVRELENLVERAVILTKGSTLAIPTPEGTSDLRMSVSARIENFEERDRITRVLQITKGRIGGATGAAARLGLKRTTLINRMNKMGITRHTIFSHTGSPPDEPWYPTSQTVAPVEPLPEVQQESDQPN
jgi:formate hydrogenlyase transcriptional activator